MIRYLPAVLSLNRVFQSFPVMHLTVTCHMLCQSYCITLADMTDKPQGDSTMQHIIQEIRKKIVSPKYNEKDAFQDLS